MARTSWLGRTTIAELSVVACPGAFVAAASAQTPCPALGPRTTSLTSSLPPSPTADENQTENIASNPPMNSADGNPARRTWTRIKFNDLDHLEKSRWDNRLEVGPDAIVFTPHGSHHPVRILKSRIVQLRYGRAVFRNGYWEPSDYFTDLHQPIDYVGRVVFSPIFVVSVATYPFHHPTPHYIGIVYSSPCMSQGRVAGLAFEADKKTYREILIALQQGVSAPLLVDKNDASRVPPGFVWREPTLYERSMPSRWPVEFLYERYERARATLSKMPPK